MSVREIDAAQVRDTVEQLCLEANYVAAVMRGDFSNAWVDTLLVQGGCEVVD